MNLLSSLSRRALFELAGGVIALVTLALIANAWHQAHDDRVRMEATLALQKPLIAAAEARERDRDAQLKQLLAQIDALKKRTLSPAEMVAQLNQQLPLPQPITITPPTGRAPRSPVKGAPKSPVRGAWGIRRAWEIGQALRPSEAEVARPAQTPPAPGAAPQHFPETQARQGSARQPPQPQAAVELPEAPGVQLPALDLKPLFNYVQDCRACQARLSVAQADLTDEKARSQALAHERDAALQAARGGSFWTRLKRNTRWFLTGAAAGAILARGL